MILVICLIVMALCVVMMFRNEAVYEYRMSLLGKVSDAAKRDIYEGNDFIWRYHAYNAVDYDEMVMKFWKPLGSFYEDKTFLL